MTFQGFRDLGFCERLEWALNHCGRLSYTTEDVCVLYLRRLEMDTCILECGLYNRVA